jgi:hypothetical protein
MAKIIRQRYSIEFSIGILLLIFALSLFLSSQIFEIRRPQLNEGKNIYLGMFLVSSAVIVMLLVLWEEFLFPIKIKPEEKGFIFRNHRNKLKTQLLIYCTIPIIFVFVYLEYEVNLIRFLVWASICIIVPVAGKLISGIRNYNDFLKLSHDTIEYKNNEKAGVFPLKDVQNITLLKDERNVLHKIQVIMKDNNQVIIDLDEMELEAFISSIDRFMTVHYKSLLKETTQGTA